MFYVATLFVALNLTIHLILIIYLSNKVFLPTIIIKNKIKAISNL
ncbi:hypothetical protein CLL_A2038 [Clostridium botulinum B str. Eklund 17B (NRP)]|uniref:Uncharacterized protein n=1 Tax=Clostridium botulinum (strain Eklund 17B / Type B) TaxID=935198 RepID=B2TMB0_CLOBB|nr:hypothetical protein CLL_A2038 [Clostridium botulinum B str. Eklund 17B (NRP)]